MRIYHQASWVPWPFGTSRPKFPPMIQSPRSGSTPCNTKEVEKQKIQAIGAQNLLQTYAKQRETELSQLTALIRESQLAHERLQSEYNSLLQLESSQNDFMEQFVLQK